MSRYTALLAAGALAVGAIGLAGCETPVAEDWGTAPQRTDRIGAPEQDRIILEGPATGAGAVREPAGAEDGIRGTGGTAETGVDVGPGSGIGGPGIGVGGVDGRTRTGVGGGTGTGAGGAGTGGGGGGVGGGGN